MKNEEFKYRKLKGRIVEKFGTRSEFAKALGISTTQLSKKLSGRAGFSQNDIVNWAKLLEIPESEYALYFFA